MQDYAEHMKKLLLVLAIPAFIVSLAACGSNESAEEVEVTGIWGSQDQGQPWLELGDDGSLAGSDGCNRLTGSWSAEGGELSVGPVGATQMFCEGVDTWLLEIHRATVEGDTLHVFSQSNQEIGTLARQ